jgi:hypothetical protein
VAQAKAARNLAKQAAQAVKSAAKARRLPIRCVVYAPRSARAVVQAPSCKILTGCAPLCRAGGRGTGARDQCSGRHQGRSEGEA